MATMELLGLFDFRIWERVHMKLLTNRERHNRIFVLVLFGYIFIGGISFLVVDPSWAKVMELLLPIVVSAFCIIIAGEPYVRPALLVTVILTTITELLVLRTHLGSWHNERFWMAAVFLLMLNSCVFIFTFSALLFLVRKFGRSKREVEVVDYKGRFPPHG